MMLCWFHKLMISHAADSDREVIRFTQRHLARCGGCRRLHNEWQRLGRDLRTQATRLRPASGQVTEQIARALNEPPRPGVALSAGLKWTAAACLVVATLIGFAIALRANRSAEPPHAPIPTIGLTEAQFKTAWTHLTKHPLANELDNLTSDTESGVRFLVACLDVSPVFDDSVPPR
jgi:hypothetical protein